MENSEHIKDCPCAWCEVERQNAERPVRRCTAHHFACDCREARFRELLEDTILAHSTPDNGNYNECDKDPCAWCHEAKALIHHGHPDGKFRANDADFWRNEHDRILREFQHRLTVLATSAIEATHYPETNADVDPPRERKANAQ